MHAIKAIIFDVDGTLYQPLPELIRLLNNFSVNKIAEKLNITVSEADKQFQELKKIYKSATKVLETIGVGSVKEISRIDEQTVTREDYIKTDQKLISMMERLSTHYQLVIMRNGMHQGTRRILKALGLRADIFSKIYSVVEDFDTTKPDPVPFERIIRDLGLKGTDEILIVGDRIAVDLTPAKKLSMRTALVTWGEKVEKHPDVDYHLETIYDIEQLLV